MELEKHIVIIGGGITGLSAAWEVQNHRQSRMRFSLLEADSNWGGRSLHPRFPHRKVANLLFLI